MTLPITIKATGMELTPAIETYLREKLSKLDRFLNKNETAVIADVEIGKVLDQNSGDIFRSEVNLEIGGTLLRAAAQESDLYAAIDIMEEEIVRELKHWKGRKETLFRRGARKAKSMLRGFSTE